MNSAAVVIELDTTAPEVLFGTVAQGGDGLLTVEYIIDETPMIMTAELIAGDEQYEMAIWPTYFSLQVPDNISTNTVIISVTVVDDVLNTQTWTQGITLISKVADFAIHFEPAPTLENEITEVPWLLMQLIEEPSIAIEKTDDPLLTLDAYLEPDES